MPVLAMKKTTVDGLSEQKMDLLRFVLRNVRLGRPVTYKQGASTLWYIWDDARISLKDLAYIAKLSVEIANFPLDELDAEGWTKAQTRGFVMGYLYNGIVFEGTPDVANPWQDILDLNNAHSSVRAAEVVPPTWTVYPPPPVEEENP